MQPPLVPTSGRTVQPLNPGEMYLGEVAAGAEETLREAEAAVEDRKRHVKGLADGDWQTLYESEPLGLEDYLAAVRRIERIIQARRAGRETYEDAPVCWLADNFDRRLFAPSEEGWLSYLVAKHPGFMGRFSQAKSPPLLESTRTAHTLVAAPTKWGKTELLKALAAHYVGEPSSAVVVIDPHGDMARQMARWPELHRDGRMVFLSQSRGHGDKVASLNPFQATGSDADVFDLLASQIGEALSEMLPDAELSRRMGTAVRNCSRILLDVPGATLTDLRHMMKEANSPRTKELVEFAKHHHDEEMREYFTDKFPTQRMQITKDGIWDRLDDLLGNRSFRRWFCQKSTVDIREAIERRNFVLIDLSDMDWGCRKTGGRLIIAMLAGLGQVRLADPRIPRTPVHVFVDEANDFMGASVFRILQEMRKAGIHLTMAQQVAGQGLPSDARASLFQNTAIKLMGGPLTGDVARIVGTPRKGGAPLSAGEFWGVWGHGEAPFRLKVRRDLANHHEKTTEAAWVAVMREQLAAYYREAPKVLPAPEPSKPSEPRPHRQGYRKPTGRPME